MIAAFTLGMISLLGAMSPGPDFAIVTRFALSGSRKAAIYASIGVVTALLIHITYCSFGVAILIKEWPLLFKTIQIMGACYLGYLGMGLLKAKASALVEKEVPPSRSFTAGFLTNLLNPKATLFIFGIYSQFVTSATSLSVILLYGAIIFGTGLGWFSLLSFCITHERFKSRFMKEQGRIMKAMGGFLILLALSVVYQAIAH